MKLAALRERSGAEAVAKSRKADFLSLDGSYCSCFMVLWNFFVGSYTFMLLLTTCIYVIIRIIDIHIDYESSYMMYTRVLGI